MFIFDSGQTPYKMTTPKIPSHRFKKMIVEKIEASQREQTLTTLQNWVNSQQTVESSNGQAGVLSNWLGQLVSIARLPTKEFSAHTHWNSANQFNTYPLFRTIVDKGLDVQ